MKRKPAESNVPDGDATPRLRLRVSAAAETTLRRGHPWLFAESVREQNREGTAGELAVVYDRKNRFLAVGLFDPDSPIRMRVLHSGKPQTLDAAWWSVRFDEAVRRRDGLFDDQTTGYRLINGESDGWPGLVLDRYDATLVLKIYTAAWWPRLEEIIWLIQTRLQPKRIVLRRSRNLHVKVRDSSHLEDGAIMFGDRLEACPTFLESGLRFEADVVRGQKTGFFLDQRENRHIVEGLARDRTMLNAFSFSGGFSVYAARGGAKCVIDLDITAHALAAAKRNWGLNETIPAVDRCPHELIQADAFEWLAGNAARKFDLIVLDPPSLAKREAERAGAIRAYAGLAEQALKHLSRGGILVACSCSAHVTAEEFCGAVCGSAVKSARKFAELQRTGHAPDHPATFREAQYLKAIYLRIE